MCYCVHQRNVMYSTREIVCVMAAHSNHIALNFISPWNETNVVRLVCIFKVKDIYLLYYLRLSEREHNGP